MATSTVPGVLAALHSLAVSTLATPYPNAKVFFGPVTGSDVPFTYVCIGYSEDENDSAVQGDTSRFGEGQSSETYTLNCYISTWDGDSDDLATKAVTTGAVFDLLCSALRANPRLNGTILAPGIAEVGNFSWLLDQYEEGCSAEVRFGVQVTEAVLW